MCTKRFIVQYLWNVQMFVLCEMHILSESIIELGFYDKLTSCPFTLNPDNCAIV